MFISEKRINFIHTRKRGGCSFDSYIYKIGLFVCSCFRFILTANKRHSFEQTNIIMTINKKQKTT